MPALSASAFVSCTYSRISFADIVIFCDALMHSLKYCSALASSNVACGLTASKSFVIKPLNSVVASESGSKSWAICLMFFVMRIFLYLRADGCFDFRHSLKAPIITSPLSNANLVGVVSREMSMMLFSRLKPYLRQIAFFSAR